MRCSIEFTGTPIKAEAAPADLTHALDLMKQPDDFVIVAREDGAFMQTTGIGEEGFVLEYRGEDDGGDPPMYQYEQAAYDRELIESCFRSFMAGDDDAFQTRVPWRRLEFDESQSGGCLGVVVAAVGALAAVCILATILVAVVLG